LMFIFGLLKTSASWTYVKKFPPITFSSVLGHKQNSESGSIDLVKSSRIHSMNISTCWILSYFSIFQAVLQKIIFAASNSLKLNAKCSKVTDIFVKPPQSIPMRKTNILRLAVCN
jgi:hypothetical protein